MSQIAFGLGLFGTYWAAYSSLKSGSLTPNAISHMILTTLIGLCVWLLWVYLKTQISVAKGVNVKEKE